MKHVPCLFLRIASGPQKGIIEAQVAPGCEWVLAGEGKAYRRWDGTAVAVIDGKFYKRYDAKRTKAPPVGAIACQEQDLVAGTWPHWVPVGDGIDDEIHRAAMLAHVAANGALIDGVYELVGPGVNGNNEGLEQPEFIFYDHLEDEITVPRTFDAIREFLSANMIEGINFVHADGRRAKISRLDFGFAWGCRKARL